MFDTRVLTGAGVVAAITETGNFARAGEFLGLSPSGVSRSVARLEAKIGVRLFHRGPRSVTLTEEGHRFYAQIRPLLVGLEEAVAEAGGAAHIVRGRLRVSADPWFTRTVLAPRMAEFLQRFPALSVDLMTSNHREDMMAGVDVAVRFGPPPDSSLLSQRLLECPVMTCASPAYLKRRGSPHTPRELDGHDLLLFRDPLTGQAFPWEFHRGGEKVSVGTPGRLMMDDPSAAIAACIAGQGIFQSLALGLEDHLARRELVQILPDWADERFPLFAFRPASRHTPAKVTVFLEFVHEISEGRASVDKV
jgi:DNA-binding transcriptional LysR family regulator